MKHDNGRSPIYRWFSHYSLHARGIFYCHVWWPKDGRINVNMSQYHWHEPARRMYLLCESQQVLGDLDVDSTSGNGKAAAIMGTLVQQNQLLLSFPWHFFPTWLVPCMSVILRAFHDTKKSGSRMPIWGVWHPLIGWQRARKHGNATLLHFDDFWCIRRSQLGNSKSFETSAQLTASASLINLQDGLPMFHVCVELEGCISDSASSVIVMFPQNPTMGLSETSLWD